MNKKYNSIDGFKSARRKIVNQAGKPSVPQKTSLINDSPAKVLHKDHIGDDVFTPKTAARTAVQNLRISSDELFDQKTSEDIDLNKKNSQRPKGKNKRERTDGKKSAGIGKWIKRLILIVFLLIIAVVVYYFVNIANKTAKVVDQVLEGDISGLLKVDPLKQDDEKRTNILIFGTESEDINSEHGGPLLTDSIMVASYSHETKNTAMISVPRDLWVRLEEVCVVGYSAKINTVYQCSSDNAKDEKSGAEALSRKMSEVLGLDIHYYVHINFNAVVSLVDAIGGVEIVIESPDPRGIYDINSDVPCGDSVCHMVKYPNGPTGLMDGQHALALIRARNAAGGYGLPRSNYDREDNQRKVLAAIIKRMMDSGVLLDVNKIMAILDTIGQNIRTNFGTNELRSAVAVAKEMSNQMGDDSVQSISLSSVTKTDNISGQSVVVPISGRDDYSAIRTYVKKQMLVEPFSSEEPSVTILNGSEQTGLAQKVADWLEEKGITVVQVGNASESFDGAGYIYLKTGVDKPKSSAYLFDKLALTADDQNPNKYQDNEADFVVVLGENFVFNQ